MDKVDKYLGEKRRIKMKKVCKDCGGNVKYNKKEDDEVCTKCGSTNIKSIEVK